ncbi:Hypothetical predicted protein [Olea europaea subsp. europaea]|uniref:Uncharacterized protein n=1 Tax=Olea europaea subsp. europaea TaxID=158383 RepID=A0A8S0V2Z4_OLEEU|nr:Hypothetical predicted protein [Olea europaea subsp. europaea]
MRILKTSGSVGDESTGGGGTTDGSAGGGDDNASGWDGLATGFGGGRVVGLEMADWLSCNLLKTGKFMSELTRSVIASPAVGLGYGLARVHWPEICFGWSPITSAAETAKATLRVAAMINWNLSLDFLGFEVGSFSSWVLLDEASGSIDLGLP